MPVHILCEQLCINRSSSSMAASQPNLFPDLPDIKGANAIIRPSAPPCSAQGPDRGPNTGKIPPPGALLTPNACPPLPPSFIRSLPPFPLDNWLSRCAQAPTPPLSRLWPPASPPTSAPLHPPLPPPLPPSTHIHPPHLFQQFAFVSPPPIACFPQVCRSAPPSTRPPQRIYLFF